MILTGLVITGGAVAASVKVYRDQKRKREFPWTVAAERLAKNEVGLLKRKRKRRMIGAVSSVASVPSLPRSVQTSISRVKSTSGRVAQEFMAAYAGDTRRQQLQELAAGTESSSGEISASDATNRKNLAIASGSLALASGGLLYAPLYVPSAFCSIYLFKYIYKTAYQAVVGERRINADVLVAVVVTGALAQGFIFLTALGAWYTMLMQRLSSKTKSDLKDNLINLFSEQPRFVWAVVSGMEVELPLENLQEGDLIVVTAGQPIPVDGTITAPSASHNRPA